MARSSRDSRLALSVWIWFVMGGLVGCCKRVSKHVPARNPYASALNESIVRGLPLATPCTSAMTTLADANITPKYHFPSGTPPSETTMQPVVIRCACSSCITVYRSRSAFQSGMCSNPGWYVMPVCGHSLVLIGTYLATSLVACIVTVSTGYPDGCCV
jgi:hypothetical protein